MKKLLVLLACVALFAIAAKPMGAVLSVASDDGTSVYIQVDLRKQVEKKDAGSVWVVAVCFDEFGVPVTRQDLPLDEEDLVGPVGPFTRSGAVCAAWGYIFGEDIISEALPF